MPTKVEAWQTATGEVFTDIDAALQQERDWALNMLASKDASWWQAGISTKEPTDMHRALDVVRSWIEDVHAPKTDVAEPPK